MSRESDPPRPDPPDDSAETALSSDGAPAADAQTSLGTSASPDPDLQLGVMQTYRTPEQVGAYRVLEELGSGAMGTVYLAEQENPRRTVALKLVRRGRATPELLRRFEHEAQVLGRLHHPGIAQIYEAGATEGALGERQPFFAMEYVEGDTLTRYVKKAELDVPTRLELVARICDAVAHAHQKGVIHRDLKPSNILVDAEGQPKVLDFGVARITDSDQQATMGTSVGQIVGTVAYMSPEQIVGSPDDLDTRSDVYALGVILHELLTGELPVDITDKALPEAARMIQEDDPARLSSVNRSFRGDVETIVGKALAKDRDRRYQTVAELAADLRRHLADEPIAARPPSTWYQFAKFARRNRALVGGVVIAFAALVAGLAGTAYGLIEAREARNLAQDEAAAAGQVVDFLSELLGGADPYTDGDSETTVRDVLERGAERIDSLDGEPGVQLRLLEVMGVAYDNLGQYESAETMLEQAVRLHEDLGSGASVDAIKLRSTLARTYLSQGRLDEADVMTRQALADIEAHPEARRFDVALVTANLAHVLIEQANWDEAESLLTATAADLEAVDDTSPRQLSQVLSIRGTVRGRQRRFDEATEDLRRALELRATVESAPSLRTASLYSDLGAILAQAGRLDEAAPILQRSLEINERFLDPDHPLFATSLHNLGSINLDLGNYEVAQDYLSRAVTVREEVFGPDHPAVTSSLNNLAKIHLEQGRYAEAAPLYQRSARIREAALGPQHPALASTFHAMGDLHRLWERHETSAFYYERAIAIQESNGTPDLPFALQSYGEVLSALGRDAEAAAALTRARELQDAETDG